MASQSSHFVLIPLMTPGHMSPMLDLARGLALRGSVVTFVTTPLNAERIRPSIDSITSARLPVRFAVIPFPCTQAGLPERCETLDDVPSKDTKLKFLHAVTLLKQPLTDLLVSSEPPRPSCFVSCSFFGFGAWVNEVARFFEESPTLLFDGTGMFATVCAFIENKQGGVFPGDATEPLLIPGIPMEYDGVIVNSFEGLETGCAEAYKAATGINNVWMVGPLSLLYRHVPSSSYAWNRGGTPEIDAGCCIEWLDSNQPRSVVYACFGSLSKLTKPQLVEIGLGLEISMNPFIWVVRHDAELEDDVWLSEFGERVKEERKGLVIRGWAPQLLILSHPSTGGFLTHCGWNSTLESISAGVPMMTLPLFAEQFHNEQLVVKGLGIGVNVGVLRQTHRNDQTNHEVVGKSTVATVVERLMYGGEEGDIRREKVRKLSAMAKAAMDRVGGSSQASLTALSEYGRRK